MLAGFRLGDLALLGIGCDVGPYLVMGWAIFSYGDIGWHLSALVMIICLPIQV